MSRVIVQRRYRRQAGLSLVELLIALTISSVLLTATMVATDACFKSYASAAESASAQSATRMVTHRLLTLIRTSTTHGPVQPDGATDPPVVQNGQFIESNYIKLIDPNNQLIMVEYRADTQQLWYYVDEDGDFEIDEDEVGQPLLGGVTSCVFSLKPRENSEGTAVLERATMVLAVEPDADTTLAIESGAGQTINVIASTMPRKLD